jgi:hypothetical protein
MIDEKQVNQAFDDFDKAVKGRGGAVAAAAVNPCDVWHNIRATVDAIITALRAIGTLFPIAKRAADVLDTLKALLNQLCP